MWSWLSANHLIWLAIALFFVLVLARPWHLMALEEGWVDASASGSDSVSVDASGSNAAMAALTTEYGKFQQWQSDFCTTWMDVVQKAQKADQNTQSQEDYIQSLEAKNATQLYRCSPTWPTKVPDLIFITQNMPKDASIFKSTIAFMKTETDTIKANTTAALAAGKKEGFVGDGDVANSDANPNANTIQPTCQVGTDRLTCIIPLGPGLMPMPAPSPQLLASQLANLNSEIAQLQPQYLQVKSNIADLNTYVNKVQSGEIFKGVLSNSS
jgi:hypothetical protein